MNFSDFSCLLSATITRADLAIWVLYRSKDRSPQRKHRSGNNHRPALSAMFVVSLLPYGILPLPLSSIGTKMQPTFDSRLKRS
jgi:hypothetical protein